MNNKDLYSIKNCMNDQYRFSSVGFNKLARNYVFYDKEQELFVKHYNSRNHYENEKNALLYYRDYDIVPNIIHAFDLCICISKINGNIIDEEITDINIYKHMGYVLNELHLKSMEMSSNSMNYGKYLTYENARLLNLFKTINNPDNDLYEFLLGILKKDICSQDTKTVLCHNDFCNRNILLLNNRVSGIIDFEKSHFADPMCDFATFAVKKHKSKEFKALINGYFDYHISDNEKKRLIYFAIYKALEITTWAEKKDILFYNMAVDFLKDWKTLYDFI